MRACRPRLIKQGQFNSKSLGCTGFRSKINSLTMGTSVNVVTEKAIMSNTQSIYGIACLWTRNAPARNGGFMDQKYRMGAILVLALIGGFPSAIQARGGLLLEKQNSMRYIRGFADGQEESRRIDLMILDEHIRSCDGNADTTQFQNCVDTLKAAREEIDQQSFSTPTVHIEEE